MMNDDHNNILLIIVVNITNNFVLNFKTILIIDIEQLNYIKLYLDLYKYRKFQYMKNN